MSAQSGGRPASCDGRQKYIQDATEGTHLVVAAASKSSKGWFIGKHWRGDYSLGRSYWLHTVLLASLMPAFTISLLARLTNNMPARYGVTGVLVIAGFSYISWLWGVVGCWRSANRHVARGGRRWAVIMAKLMIVFGAFSLGSSSWHATGSFREMLEIARGKQLGPPVTYQVRAGGKSILLQGGMNDGAADGLARALDAAPEVTTVVLYSAGGWVREGKLVADVIAGRGLNTYVEQECSSACTLAFLAGRDRAIDPHARLGFHTLYTVGGDDRINKPFDRALTQQTYSHFGLPYDFIERIADTPQSGSWYPTIPEMLRATVLTRISAGGETTVLATMAATREDLANEFRKSALFNLLARHYPLEFKRIVDLAWTRAQASATDNEILAASREQLGMVTRRLLPIASDRALAEFQQLVLDQAEALRIKSATACTELIFPGARASNSGAGPQALLPPDFAAREMKVTMTLISDSDPLNARRFTQREKAAALRKALSSLSRDELKLLSSPAARVGNPVATCNATVAYLQAVNNLPEDERATVFRMLYSQDEKKPAEAG
ncbi:hypothetical protein PQR62_10880 [Herbaspirillum lusitanum]|uniref:Transmembrane protein n=1 Tax=Herbaspirillum lusitanum TaxID=213312 RepID=A0ABW9A7G4_9BURK